MTERDLTAGRYGPKLTQLGGPPLLLRRSHRTPAVVWVSQATSIGHFRYPGGTPANQREPHLLDEQATSIGHFRYPGGTPANQREPHLLDEQVVSWPSLLVFFRFAFREFSP
ncbi:hypothetical protein GW7_04605 [Heterocephalus glaber]|uniref:Uncharacterized protein n=1 Tax=Heterocephalus glaber TaxID=10181 RepID=G5BW91_HETGA|nr:hypothetical protein GW7_04605 [Heterocephalus glaber]